MAELLHPSWRRLLEDLEARMSSEDFAELQEQVQEACAICTEASQLTATFAFTPEIMSSRSPPDVVVRVGSLSESSLPGANGLGLPAHLDIGCGGDGYALPQFWSLATAHHRLQKLRKCMEAPGCLPVEIADAVLGPLAMMPQGMADAVARADLEVIHARECRRRWHDARQRLLEKALRYWHADVSRSTMRLAFGAWASEREAAASSRARVNNSTPKVQSRNSARSPRTGVSPTTGATSAAAASQKAKAKAKTATPRTSSSHGTSPRSEVQQRPARLSGNRSSELNSAAEMLQLADDNERLRKQLEEALEQCDELQKRRSSLAPEVSDLSHNSLQIEEPPVDLEEVRRARNELREMCDKIRDQAVCQDVFLPRWSSQRLMSTGQTTPVPGVLSIQSSNPALSSDHSPAPGGGISPVPSVRMHETMGSKCSSVVTAPVSVPTVPSPRASVGSARSPAVTGHISGIRPAVPLAIRPATIIGGQAVHSTAAPTVARMLPQELRALSPPSGTPVLRSPVAMTPREV